MKEKRAMLSLGAVVGLLVLASFIPWGTACAQADNRPEIALVFGGGESYAAYEPDEVDDVQACLLDSGCFADVVKINASYVVPDFDHLLAYDALLVWTNTGGFSEPHRIGDLLADYVDSGGGVVLAVFAFNDTGEDIGIGGRFAGEGYYLIQPGSGQTSDERRYLGEILEPDHPVMQGVDEIDGGSSSYHSPAFDLHPDATEIARWDTGELLVAAAEFTAGRRVDVNVFPPCDRIRDDLWPVAPGNDVARLLANALRWASDVESIGIYEGFGFSRAELRWSLDGDVAWETIGAPERPDGLAAAAGPMEHNETATLATTTTVEAGAVSFAFRVSTESSCDFLRFYVDGDLLDEWAGESDWEVVEYEVTAGEHEFVWEYSKDGSVSHGEDRVWIDEVAFPGVVSRIAVAISEEALPWESSPEVPWIPIEDPSRPDGRSAGIGRIGHNQTSYLEVTSEVREGDVRFALRVSTEENYDFLVFSIDGAVVERWSGEQAWIEVSFSITAGEHTFRWAYETDGSSTSGEDMVWIDDVQIPRERRRWVAIEAGAAEDTEAEITLVDGDTQSTTFEIRIRGLWLEDVEVDGTVYQRVSVPGLGTSREVGAPALPVVSELLGVVTDADAATVEEAVAVDDPIVLDDVNPYPYQQDTKDCEGECDPGPFLKDEALYTSDAAYPQQRATAGNIQLWLRVRVVRVCLFVAVARPAARRLSIFARVRVRVRHAGNLLSQQLLPTLQTLQALLRALINGPRITPQLPSRLGTQYLILTADRFAADIEPLATWKRCKGYNVTVRRVPRDIANTYAAIKAYVTGVYNQAAGYDLYVLLVGDIADIASGSHTSPVDGSSGLSDHAYECVAGNDPYPDLYLGRISADNSADVREIVRKILTYEQIPPAGAWTGNALIVAHKQGPPTTYINNMEAVRTFAYSNPPTFIRAYGRGAGGAAAAGNTLVAGTIDPTGAISGVGLVAYRGHGGKQTWASWSNLAQPTSSWGLAEINALSNGNITPVVLSICCWNSDITTEDCIGEEWLEAPSEGAVAHYGATVPSWTQANHSLNIEMFKSIYHHGQRPLGPALAFAEGRILGSGGTGSTEEDNVWWYMLLGDPDMALRI